MESNALKIYIVEDDEWYGKMLEYTLKLNPDDQIARYSSGKEFLKKLDEQPDIVTLDFRLPDFDGAEVLKKIKAFNPEIEVIIISEQDSVETAVKLLKEGAYDYIVKQQDIRERLLNTIRNIRNKRLLKTEISDLKKEVKKKYNFRNALIGSSPSMVKVFQLLEKAASTNINVIITGETGTGKEMAAKAIHYNSSRKDFPFVAINVAAIPGELIESELFGHEKGAFTGATNRRIGKFEEADKGTLFLDEIGEMNIAMQSKLLRALQEKEISRVGSNERVKTDCRIIAATHKNLQEEVKKGAFREDLYYRLYGLTIALPLLKERGNDILLLARHFVADFCNENNLPEKSITPSAQQKLMSYSYPGNVRELKSVVELAVVMSTADEITGDDIFFGTDENVSIDKLDGSELTLKQIEERIIKSYLQKYNNNVKLVAEKLDIGQSTIYRMLKAEKQ
ncbi:MAG TPA: sigma-54 dependent transcriptional regulator [Chitinophagales bacterium]|nr:sigma-54 dependent transcriptional regulator [Chitinophagales bacterium]